jgi:hypothetical protein
MTSWPMALAGGALYLLLLDAAVETWLAGWPDRWIAAGTVAGYLALSALLRRRVSGGARAALSLIVLLALLAFGAWRPTGASGGVVMLRQAPGAVLAGATSLAMLLAASTLLRARFLPAGLRIAAAAMAAYGFAATVWGIVAATPYSGLLHGQSLWTRLPFWLQGTFVGGLVLLPCALLVQVGAAVAGRRGGSRRTDLLLAVTSALALAIVAGGFFVRGGAGAADGAAAAGAGQNGPGLQPLTVASLRLPVQRTLDLAHVQPGHFAAALGNDPSRIFEFVRDQVAYEPYAGCLRGPRGTLLALAGNSVDRAALLASLLTAAGQRARFARGVLPDDRVQDLVASVFAQRPEVRPPQPPKNGPEGAGADLLAAGVERDTRLLAASLKKAGLPAAARVTRLESLAAEAREHYWVQWWRGSGWVDMDPSFASAAPGAAYAAPAATLDALPDALFHRVDIRVRVEEYTRGTPSTREVLRYSTKAADLSGVDVVLAHLSERPRPPAEAGSGLGALSSAPANAGQAGQVKPVLILPGQVVGGSPFWETAPDRRTGAGFDSFLGGGEEAMPEPVAVAEFLQFEFVAPGGTDSVVRDVFDLVGPARRRAGEKLEEAKVSALTRAAGRRTLTDTIYDIFVTTGSLHAAHLENLVVPPPPAAGEPVDLQPGLQRVNVLFAATSDSLLDRLTPPGGGVCRFYLDSPRVHVAELSVGASELRLTLDLRRDQARAVGTGLPNEHLFAAQVLRGVVNGHLERVLGDFLASPEVPGAVLSAPTMSTSLVFERAQASRAPIVLLERDATALAGDVPADGRARVENALAAGWVALAPTGPVDVGGEPRLAWWQVDRRSGATIAVTDAGLHQLTVELSMVESRKNGRVVVFEGAAKGQGAASRACAHPTNFDNAGKAYEYVNRMMNLMKSNGQKYNFTHYLTEFAL